MVDKEIRLCGRVSFLACRTFPGTRLRPSVQLTQLYCAVRPLSYIPGLLSMFVLHCNLSSRISRHANGTKETGYFQSSSQSSISRGTFTLHISIPFSSSLRVYSYSTILIKVLHLSLLLLPRHPFSETSWLLVSRRSGYEKIIVRPDLLRGCIIVVIGLISFHRSPHSADETELCFPCLPP